MSCPVCHQNRPCHCLRNGMSRLCTWVRTRADEKGYVTDDHHTLYHETAVEFNLYDAGADGEPSAPIWLSRVVAGVLQDRSEGTSARDI
jgi:hypothetical protein